MLEKSARMEAVSPVGRTVRQTAAHAAAADPSASAVRSAAMDAAAPQSDVLALAEAIARQSPPIDAVRVAALREKIANGDYPIQVAATALAIANALVAPGEV
jgi:flagellar biosynthesis anti-sigma factor FlgM